MQRSRLKNIANKSKEMMKPIVGEFEQFKNSLPIEIDDNYRLEAAWKAYGKPKNYQEALWEGLVQPIDDKTFKMPSIGYNEETEEYEYLNKGKENETVNKDIRVWDNDVIPFVKELKQGGFIRTFDKEKDCWKYSKHQLSPEINKFQTGGQFSEYELFLSGLPENLRTPTSDYNMKRYWELNGKPKTWFEALNRKMFTKQNDGYYHANTVAYNKDADEYEFMKQPNHPTIQEEIDWYNSPEGFEFSKEYKLVKPEDGSAWKYVRRNPKAFKQGGQMNVIPEGALHARKNNMEGAGEDFTHKGIPVVDNDGEQQAEIERNEVIFNKDLTNFIESNYKKFKFEETKNDEKDEIAIKVGKRLVKELLTNTDDRTGLISEVEQKM